MTLWTQQYSSDRANLCRCRSSECRRDTGDGCGGVVKSVCNRVSSRGVCGGTGVNVRVPEGHAVQGTSFSMSVQGVPGGEGSNGVSYFITFRW